MKQQSNRVRLTAGRVDAFTCPTGKAQSFLWDTETPTLALRATPTGRKTYVFEARLNGATIRINIGTLADWPIEKARTRAQELKRLVDAGTDPREVERDRQTAAVEKKAAAAAAQVQAAAHALTTGEVWAVYMAERRPHWGDWHFKHHIRSVKAGGIPSKRGTRGKGVTVAGPLYPFMAMPLRELDAPTIEAWAINEAKTRATTARLAWRCLKVFLTWCSEQPAYAGLLPAKNPAKTTRSREALGKPGVKQDALMREQLSAWFDAVREMSNTVIAAYLQTLLLTGARPGEIQALRWDDINIKWKGMTIGDKMEDERVIPLTPYVSHLISALPRRNEFVFSGVAGSISPPHKPLTTACKVAGVDHLTLHGLRRSFKSLTEWMEIPTGVVAQIMGHKPSATAEKHYTVRPLDLLRMHHEKIEAWILEQAGVNFEAKATPGGLHVVSA